MYIENRLSSCWRWWCYRDRQTNCYLMKFTPKTAFAGIRTKMKNCRVWYSVAASLLVQYNISRSKMRVTIVCRTTRYDRSLICVDKTVFHHRFRFLSTHNNTAPFQFSMVVVVSPHLNLLWNFSFINKCRKGETIVKPRSNPKKS